MTQYPQRTFGFDIGIASCGWAVIEDRSRIIDMGVWLFDAPETEDRTPKNQIRRTARGLRRVLRRRRQRMRHIRELFAEHNLIATPRADALEVSTKDPWTLRAEGLDNVLSPLEFAIALAHIAKHRGFKSNSKRDRGSNAPKDTKGMLGAIEHTRSRLASYRTPGEMMARDPAFTERKRNRDGDYSRSLERDAIAREVTLLFSTQRRLGNKAASTDLEAAFVAVAFHQRPLADSEDSVGFCRFFPTERRAPRRSFSFELFRHMSRLANLRLRSRRSERSLTADEIRLACNDFGAHRGMTFRALRNIIGLSDTERFDGVPVDEESKRQVVSRNGDSAAGTYALRKVLGSAWASFLADPETADRVASVLSFRESDESIRSGLQNIGLDPLVFDTIMDALADGRLSDFTGAADLSSKACRALIPHLLTGLDFTKACAAAGLRDPDERAGSLATLVAAGENDKALSAFRVLARETIDTIGNPVARKSLSEASKQFVALVREYGIPGKIHIELARDVGKSTEERDEITAGIEKRNAEKDRLRKSFTDLLKREPRTDDELLRFELWHEQKGFCLYTGHEIPVFLLQSNDNETQVDHILPWSRSGDDSFINKTLCFASANQEKKGRTPFEWFRDTKSPEEWEAFVARVETTRPMKGRKKRNYLLKDASELEGKFRNRNLGDTRYATRVFADLLRALYPKSDATRSVFARPGALTDRLRRGWGIQGLKKDANGKRIPDDRHHAIDALVVAATSEAMLQALTRAFKAAEDAGSVRDFKRLDPPWPGFVEEVSGVYEKIFVARSERRRARGKGHDATIKGVKESQDGLVVYKRKAVEELTTTDLVRIANPERNAKLIDTLRSWIDSGRKKGTKPISPQGHPISKVKLRTNDKVAVRVRGGTADRGDIIRVDIFTKPNKRGRTEFFAVPIYPHQVMNTSVWPMPPNRAVQSGIDEDNWPIIDESYIFRFSIYPLSYVELKKSNGEIFQGYMRGLDRSTGAITISGMTSKTVLFRSLGLRTLLSLKKFQVDRLGRRSEIQREQRTWHGVVCT